MWHRSSRHMHIGLGPEGRIYGVTRMETIVETVGVDGTGEGSYVW